MQQTTIDREHSGWPVAQELLKKRSTPASVKRRLRRLDLGGEFLTERQLFVEPVSYRFNASTSNLVGTYVTNLQQYAIPVSNIQPTDIIWPRLDPEEDVKLWGLGSSAIKGCAPVLPATSLSTSIGELREGLPKLAYKLGSITTAANSSASNFLGWQFGVKPLINDFKNISKAIHNYDKVLARFERESGELLHRKFRFDTTIDRTLESTTTSSLWPAPLTPNGSTSGVKTTSLIRKEETWFSGAFSFTSRALEKGLSLSSSGVTRWVLG
jgi:hypothetical protein